MLQACLDGVDGLLQCYPKPFCKPKTLGPKPACMTASGIHESDNAGYCRLSLESNTLSVRMHIWYRECSEVEFRNWSREVYWVADGCMLVCLHEMNTWTSACSQASIATTSNPWYKMVVEKNLTLRSLDLLHGRLYMSSSEYMVSGQKNSAGM